MSRSEIIFLQQFEQNHEKKIADSRINVTLQTKNIFK